LGAARKGLAIGHFAQHQIEMLRHDQTPLRHLAKLAPNVREQQLRSFLGSFNFIGEMATTKVDTSSGGEKARLVLALIVWHLLSRAIHRTPAARCLSALTLDRPRANAQGRFRGIHGRPAETSVGPDRAGDRKSGLYRRRSRRRIGRATSFPTARY
jgi:hypothetical protein